MKLYLIRHGQTSSNTTHALDTAFPGAGLTDIGREQAEGLVKRLDGVRIDAIGTSDLVRTGETAAPLAAARGIEPSVDERLREARAGDLEMKDDIESIELYHSVLDPWGAGNLSESFPSGETGEAILERFSAGVADVCKRAIEVAPDGEEPAAVVVAHGFICRAWSLMVADNPDVINRLPNTAIGVLTGQASDAGTPDSWHVEQWGGEWPWVDPSTSTDAMGPA